MTDGQKDHEAKVSDTPARVGDESRLSAIWLVPVVAVLVGIFMVYQHWVSQGPVIEITFADGTGIEAGKTKIKRKNVEIGEALEIRLSEDARSVVLSARIEKHAARLLREDSEFWVVRPIIGAGGISGLNTLLSGSYIEMAPGSSQKRSRAFEGLEAPPLTPPGTPGLHITLDSAGNRALNLGDPIIFNGMTVGTIEYVHFNNSERVTYYNAFIEEEYADLITTNTRFWFHSGVTVDLSAEGVRVELAPLATLMTGGVAFGVPDGQRHGNVITERAFFSIYPRESAIYEEQHKHTLTYVILFDNSIRGLVPGAPVEYRGVKVGKVTRTDIDYPDIDNLLEPDSRIPVMIEVAPASMGFADSESALRQLEKRMDELIAGGLRGGLATGSLLTGKKFIELKYSEIDDEFDRPQSFANYTVIPPINDQLGQFLISVENTLATINELPLDQLAQSARVALDEVAPTLAELRKSAARLEGILANPASQEIMTTLTDTLIGFEALAADFSEGSLTHRELQNSLVSLERTLNELEPLLRDLRQKPNSLIFGGSRAKDIEPKGIRE